MLTHIKAICLRRSCWLLYLAGQTRNIRLGTAIICLNLHHPLDVAEQVAVADLLSKGRMAVGFGSGSTPEEVSLFGLSENTDLDRHRRFEQSLRLIRSAWGVNGGDGTRATADTPAWHTHSPSPHQMLPIPAVDLTRRSWVAVNSTGSARIAGALEFNVMFSHLRTPEQYREYSKVYREAGGRGLLAANRPVFVGPDDKTAIRQAEPALRILWRRFRQEGKIAAETPEPRRCEDLCAHPINFIVGGPQSVARQLYELHEQAPFDIANVEVRWAGLSHDFVRESLRRLTEDVMPLLAPGASSVPSGV